MNRSVLTMVQITVIVVLTIACGVIAYFVVSSVTGHQLATASGNMAFSRWQEKFQSLVINAAILSALCALAWFVLTRWIFKINLPRGIGKRTIWAGLAILNLIGCIVISQVYSSTLGIKTNFLVTVIFIIVFVGIGYWLLTIYTTPNIFKYTPIGAQLLRAGK